jgi:hypothetical protein
MYLWPCREIKVGVTLGLAGLAGCLALSPAYAMDFDYSGFASVVTGVTRGGCTPGNTMSSAYSASCTRFIADWAHGGVYSSKLSAKPESKLGLQGSLRLLDDLSATAQVVGRFADHTHASLEWAYLSYQINEAFTVQLGRKRLPLYYFSTTQDVSYSYPWVRLSPDIYGWDAVNYNGANVGYSTYLAAGWSLKSNLFGGAERNERSGYAGLIYDEPKDIEWSNIRGSDIEVNKQWFTARLNYILTDYRQIDRATGSADRLPSGKTTGKQKIYGGSINIDFEPWLVRSEYSVFDRNDFQYESKAWLVGAGRRFGRLVPMLTFSAYREATPFPDDYAPAGWKTQSVSLRYEIGVSSAIKVQLDRFREDKNPFAGNSNVISASYDLIF